MAREVVAIKVKIGLRPNGHADHPDWLALPLARVGEPVPRGASGSLRERRQALVNQHIRIGWKYDKTSGHQDDTADSPFGQQFGMLMVSELFASQAETLFPTLITRLDETEAQTFWETKAHAHLPKNSMDSEALTGLQAERALKMERKANAGILAEVDARIDAALDPLSATPGVRKNKDKMWADAKVRAGVTIRPLP